MISSEIHINLFNIILKKKIKVCVCTCGKDENRYIEEFANHYINYGIDKIYIYDNNDIDGERFENILNGYLKNTMSFQRQLKLWLFH